MDVGRTVEGLLGAHDAPRAPLARSLLRAHIHAAPTEPTRTGRRIRQLEGVGSASNLWLGTGADSVRELFTPMWTQNQ